MDLSEPATAVMSVGTAAVLRTLAGADVPFSVRHLARLAGISHSRAVQAVDRLSEHGLVTVDTSPGSHLVRLNREHMATEYAVGLATLRTQVIDRLRQELSGWTHPVLHAALFGSAARGDGNTRSDIDLLVVHEPFASPSDQERWDDQLARTGEMIHRWTANWVGWFQLSDEDLRRMATAREPLIGELQRDAITLMGLPLAAIAATR